MNSPNRKNPCSQCPFRKDVMRGWLGSERMKEILSQKSFTCHKTNKALQCAGHMIIKGEENDFVKLANKLRIDTCLTGHELIFKSEEDLINRHSRL